MDKESSLFAIMLAELPQVGRAAATRILATNRKRGHGLPVFFRLPPVLLAEEYELPAAAIARLSEDRRAFEDRCSWLAQQLDRAGGRAWILDEPEYPRRLRERLEHPPPIVFAFGAWPVLDGPTIAVLNSRSISERTVTASVAIARTAVEQGFTIVGGGMKASHRITAVAARAAAAPRVVVLDRGLFATFGARTDRDPFGFGPGRGVLDRDRVLVVSGFRLTDHAVPHNGRDRDEIIAALADVIVAGEVRPGGVIERVCLQALDQGQTVLSWYGENAGLVAAGATPIEESALAGELRQFLRD